MPFKATMRITYGMHQWEKFCTAIAKQIIPAYNHQAVPVICSGVTVGHVPRYRIAENFGGVKLFWRPDRFRVLAKESVGEFTIAYISYFSESGIWLGKILANGIPFTKSAKVFPAKFCSIQYVSQYMAVRF